MAVDPPESGAESAAAVDSQAATQQAKPDESENDRPPVSQAAESKTGSYARQLLKKASSGQVQRSTRLPLGVRTVRPEKKD